MKVEISVNNLPNSINQRVDDLIISQTIEGLDNFSFSFKLDNEERITLRELTGLMGEVVQIKLEGKATLYFHGIVKDTNPETRGGERWFTVSGVGLLGWLDGQYGNRAFANTTIKDTFEALASTDYLSITEAAGNTPVTWAIQAGESNAAFLRRLAARHNLTCYSDGQQLVVRHIVQPIEGGIAIDAEELDDLDAHLGCQAIPKATGWDYRVERGDLESMVPPCTSGNPLWRIARTASIDRYGTVETLNYGLSRNPRLNARQIYETGLLDRATHFIGATSFDDRVRIGEVVRLDLSSLIDGLEESRPYRVTAVKHTYGVNGVYNNIFEAVPADVALQADVPFFLSPQRFLATVTSDTDQQQLGRVSVELSFAPGVSSPHIPVLLSQKIHDLPTPGTRVVIECAGDDEDLMVVGTFYHANSRNYWSPGAFGLYYENNGLTVAANEGNVGVYVTGDLTLKCEGDTNVVSSGNTIINTQLNTTITGMGFLYLFP
jgi:hypothetical protein